MSSLSSATTPSSSSSSSAASSSCASLIISLLPMDCKNILFSFLTIKECLQFSQTSKESLRIIALNMKQRQRQLLQQREFCMIIISNSDYTFNNHEQQNVPFKIRFQRIENDDDNNNKRMNVNNNNNDWIALPTFVQQVEQLHSVIGATDHFLKKPIKELMQNLLDIQNQQKQEQQAQQKPAIVNHEKIIRTAFQSIFAMFQSNTKVFQLYHYIVTQAMYYQHEPKSFCNNSNDNITMTMSDYVGNVWVAYYLVSLPYDDLQQIATFDNWAKSLLQECLLDKTRNDDFSMSNLCTNLTVQASYRLCAYLHALFLRILSFTPQQRQAMGITTVEAAATPTKPDPLLNNSFSSSSAFANATTTISNSLPPPFDPIKQQSTFYIDMLLHVLSHVTNSITVKATFHSFGALGPTFRGRDFIRTRILRMSSLLQIVAMFSKNDNQNLLSSFLRSWEANNRDNIVFNYLYEVHVESRKNRPMTVAPPLITILSHTTHMMMY